MVVEGTLPEWTLVERLTNEKKKGIRGTGNISWKTH